MNRNSARCFLLGALAMSLAGCDMHRAEQSAPGPATSKVDAQIGVPRTGYALVDGIKFYYEVFGDLIAGETPLLVLHGFFMSSDAMAPLIRELAKTRPVIAFDARGHGRTVY